MHQTVLHPLAKLLFLVAVRSGGRLGTMECLVLHFFTFKFLDSSRNILLQLPSQILGRDPLGLEQTFPRICKKFGRKWINSVRTTLKRISVYNIQSFYWPPPQVIKLKWPLHRYEFSAKFHGTSIVIMKWLSSQVYLWMLHIPQVKVTTINF